MSAAAAFGLRAVGISRSSSSLEHGHLTGRTRWRVTGPLIRLALLAVGPVVPLLPIFARAAFSGLGLDVSEDEPRGVADEKRVIGRAFGHRIVCPYLDASDNRLAGHILSLGTDQLVVRPR